MPDSLQRVAERSSVIPLRQRLPVTARLLATGLSAFVLFVLASATASGELFDSLDAFPPRWQLDTSDCDARVKTHRNRSQGGVDGGGCETLTFHAGIGSEALLVYPIEPVRAIDDLVAKVSILSARAGARIGVRVRFPYSRDKQTRRPIATVVYGGTYERAGKYQSLIVSDIERPLRIRSTKLRSGEGAETDLRDPYVDAIVINAYSGPGSTTILIDSVSVTGMLPIGDHGRVDRVPTESTNQQDASIYQAGRMLRMKLSPSDTANNPMLAPAFPREDIIRILEHRGEPLQWVRSLGFDAVLLSKPPTAEILREAIQSRLLVYAPPPLAPDPQLQALLDPLAGWYLGVGVALDNRRVKQTDATVRRLRSLPSQWQRPIVVVPRESWAQYSASADAVVMDMAPRARGISGNEQSQLIQHRKSRIGSRCEFAVAVSSSPPKPLLDINQSIEDSIGAPSTAVFRWQAMWGQTMRALQHNPRAILFRSSESLVSGTALSHQRSMALSYVNRFVAMVAPWMASARPSSPPRVSGAEYHCFSVQSGDAEFLVLTSEVLRGSEMLAGDGQSLQIQLPPGAASRTAWRLTDFSARTINVQSAPDGARLELVSPDFVEMIALSSDATLGTGLQRSAARFARRAASDRWQLVVEQLNNTRETWNDAARFASSGALAPVDLLTVANQTVQDAEPYFRAGDSQTTLRLARRADAWNARATWRLSEALMPDWQRSSNPRAVSCPPIDAGMAMLQVAWSPLMTQDGWGYNLIASGGLDSNSVFGQGQWEFGKRDVPRANSDIQWVSRGYFDGAGAVRMTAGSTTEEPLAGGYEGTVAMLASPQVQVEGRRAIRIDAMVRTIGFGRPHQGLLIYDSIGGQESGVLIRGATDWTPVRLYRQSDTDTDVRVMFEVIGGGEAIIDEVSMRLWDPEPLQPLPLQPIDPS